ncbi:hypothetical protein, partial [Oenococcus oeni]|uniref:hypothetical protein n=1 Tax=Oenococcus oeni TaxID=1247 RepID=UPI000B201E86
PKPGVPESFRVLVKELQALGLDMKVLNGKGQEVKMAQMDEDDNVATDDALEQIAKEKPDLFKGDDDDTPRIPATKLDEENV